jgi:hypothetical protein
VSKRGGCSRPLTTSLPSVLPRPIGGLPNARKVTGCRRGRIANPALTGNPKGPLQDRIDDLGEIAGLNDGNRGNILVRRTKNPIGEGTCWMTNFLLSGNRASGESESLPAAVRMSCYDSPARVRKLRKSTFSNTRTTGASTRSRLWPVAADVAQTPPKAPTLNRPASLKLARMWRWSPRPHCRSGNRAPTRITPRS